jgi:hypothetical protein
MAEELWREVLGHEGRCTASEWPEFDAEAAAAEEIEMAVQVNGKVRGRVTVAADGRRGGVSGLSGHRERAGGVGTVGVVGACRRCGEDARSLRVAVPTPVWAMRSRSPEERLRARHSTRSIWRASSMMVSRYTCRVRQRWRPGQSLPQQSRRETLGRRKGPVRLQGWISTQPAPRNSRHYLVSVLLQRPRSSRIVRPTVPLPLPKTSCACRGSARRSSSRCAN